MKSTCLFLFLGLAIHAVRADPEVVYATWEPETENKVVLHYAKDHTVTQEENSPPKHYVLRATYDNAINKTGWAFLEIHTNAGFDDETQAFTAGFVEGSVMPDLIAMHWTNTLDGYCSDGDGRRAACRAVQRFLDENRAWVVDMVANYSDSDPYWHQVKLFYKQVDGLYAGYRSAIKNTTLDLTLNDFLWLNLVDDINDLMQAVGGLKSRPEGPGCSALVRLLHHARDLLVSHATWNGYGSMLRVQKKYVLPVREAGGGGGGPVPGQAATFSSYPGVLLSGDDFYLLSSGLVVLETTYESNNASRWRYVQPRGQVLESVRHVVANRLSADGRTWVKTLARYNSGTYNNQWMAVDFSRFKAGGRVANGTLWVLEQLPGMVRYADRTDQLRKRGYWASYNLPADPDVYRAAGYPALVSKFGDWFTYEKSPRALIFKRDYKTVSDVPSMMRLMRSNDYQHDPLSKCDCKPPYSAENAIASRNDLNPKNGTYPFSALGHRSHGATDAKVTNSSLVSNLQFLAVSGPTTGAHLPPFQWSTSDFRDTVSHVGHPDRWTFKPVLHDWHWHSDN